MHLIGDGLDIAGPGLVRSRNGGRGPGGGRGKVGHVGRRRPRAVGRRGLL